MESTTTEEAPMAEGLPEEANGIGKNDRDRSTLTSGNSLRVHSFQAGRFPAKFGFEPIKFEL